MRSGRDHQGVDQPGLLRLRGDVAVAGRAERDGRVVERVEQRQVAAGVGVVVVALAVEVDEQDGAEEDRGGQEEPPPELPPRRPLGLREGDPPHAGVDAVGTHGQESRTLMRSRSRCTSSSRARVVLFCGKTVSKAALTAAPISTASASR